MNLQNKYLLSSEDAGIRLDVYLANKIDELSRSKVKKAIDDGFVSVNGNKDINSSYILKEKDEIEILIQKNEGQKFAPNHNIKLDIIHEDDYLAVINKQAGLTVHPGAGNYQDTLANALAAHFKNSLSTIGGEARPGIVHRLDKDTSGLMLIAKDDNTHNLLSHMIKEKEVRRIYLLLCYGIVKQAAGIIDTYIDRARHDHTKMIITQSKGKRAITHYKIVDIYKTIASKVECELETGRTHQIRAHFSHLGNSVIGDPKYGNNLRKFKKLPDSIAKDIQKFKRQALHSHKLKFIHPLSKKLLEFEIDPPEDMAKLIKIFEKYKNE